MSHESVWNSRPRTYGKGARAWYPCLHPQSWFDPQVWPEHLPSMLQREGRRHWIRQAPLEKDVLCGGRRIDLREGQ